MQVRERFKLQEEEGEAAKENKWILGSNMLNWGPKNQKKTTRLEAQGDKIASPRFRRTK